MIIKWTSILGNNLGFTISTSRPYKSGNFAVASINYLAYFQLVYAVDREVNELRKISTE